MLEIPDIFWGLRVDAGPELTYEEKLRVPPWDMDGCDSNVQSCQLFDYCASELSSCQCPFYKREPQHKIQHKPMAQCGRATQQSKVLREVSGQSRQMLLRIPKLTLNMERFWFVGVCNCSMFCCIIPF